MIKLRVIHSSNLYPKTEYVCYNCATVESFYTVPPSKCEGCRFPVPDVCRIMDNIESRKAYHKTAHKKKETQTIDYFW